MSYPPGLLRRWIWPLLLATTIVMASGRSQVAAPPVVNIDKLSHFAVFGLLATLFARTQPPRRWWWGVVLASAFGISDEWHQSFTPGRSVEFADWVADTTGAIVAVSVYARWAFYRRALERNLGPGRRLSVAKPARSMADTSA